MSDRAEHHFLIHTRVVRVSVMGGVIRNGKHEKTFQYVVVADRFEMAREITEALIRGGFFATIETVGGTRYGVKVPAEKHDDAVAFVRREGLDR